MPKLKYKRVLKSDSSKFALMVSAKIKELIDFYEISSLFIFQKEFNKWINAVPQKNAYSISNAFRLKIDNCEGKIWKHNMGSDKEPVLFYEIWEEVSNA